ncbi:MAG TPA: CBS domain-containing protein [Planctomycetota bacterium]|nr:CBS domain-containing protein [Planctomycetota bacterium]
MKHCLKVRDVMSAPVITVAPEVMLSEQVGSVVVVDAADPELPVGIVTWHDLLKCLVPEAVAAVSG